ncbi:MAG: hypothetical protein ABEJ02_00280 [Candidatus Paceibacteria bacterium]
MMVFIKYWDGFLSGAASLAGFYLLSSFPNYYALSLVGIGWLGVLLGLFYRRYRESEDITDLKRYLITLSYSVFGFAGVYLLVEWQSVRILLAILAAVCIGGVFTASVKLNLSKIAEYKPWRRMFMMLIVFDSYLLLTTLFGLDLFFSNLIPFWGLSIIGSVIFVVSSLVIWQLYYDKQPRSFLIWLILVAIIIFELMWSAQFLPFGYLVLGLIITWIWYILQLLIRFHISKKGIIWSKQRFFLAGNVVLFSIFMYFVRWI